MATPQRLPIVNQDDGVWGDIIRQFLMKEHVNTDTDLPTNGGHKNISITAGTAAAGTAPLKFTSGTSLTTPEAGAMEFTTDSLFFTITTGTNRRRVALYDDASGATGDTYFRNSSGLFTRLGVGATNQQLTVNGGVPVWADTTYPTASATTGTYTVTATNTVIFANAASGAVTITLPAAASLSGYRFYIKRTDSTANTVSVTPASGTIDGAASQTLNLQYAAIMVVSDGSNWYIF